MNEYQKLLAQLKDSNVQMERINDGEGKMTEKEYQDIKCQLMLLTYKLKIDALYSELEV